VLEIPVENQRAISAQRNLKIHGSGGQQILVEVGVLRQVVSELTTFVFCRGKTEDSCD
jgi:hypothetical protein